MVSEKVVEKLVGFGGNRWGNGKIDRIYFSPKSLGVDIESRTYSAWEALAGESDAMLNPGTRISKRDSADFEQGKFFLDIASGKVGIKTSRDFFWGDFVESRIQHLLRKAELEQAETATEQVEQAETATSGLSISLDRLDDQTFNNLAQLAKTYEHLLCKATGFSGLKLTSEKLVFLGLNANNDAHKLLVDYLMKFATSQKQVRTRETLRPDNEKFAFRTWLIRLGWKGRETSKLRTSLYKGLTGNSAFCTAESQERWLEKHGKH